MLYYGNEDALNYVYSLISSYIEKLNLICYRQDFNTYLDERFAYNDDKDREGITEIKHILGMYELWDRLLAKFSDLIIDNCSAGGRRIDIETLSRSIPFFISDYQCELNEVPEVIQVHNSNVSVYLPFRGCTTYIKSDTYAARSAYSSSFGASYYYVIFQSMNDEDFAWASKISKEYKYLRKYFSKDFYNHGSTVYDLTSWTIWQYHDEESQSGVLMAFIRRKSPFESLKVHLKGVRDDGQYN